jgi:PAS domain S-box-containing protein
MRLTAFFRDASIRSKLMLIAFLATLGAMLFAMLVSAFLQWFLLRNELAKNVYAQASIVATNSTSALLFNDHEAAEQTLGALAVIDNIEFAELFDKTGNDFAVYVRSGSVMPPHHQPSVEGESNTYSTKYLEVVVPVVFKQERVGTIQVRSNLVPVYEGLILRMLVIMVDAAGALLVGMMMLFWLIPTITEPLLNLVGLMNTVSRDKNYTLRAELRGRDEVGTLAKGFNNMLEQIQTRDDELALHRERLEAQVEQRTAALKEANQLLEKELLDHKMAELALHDSEEKFRTISNAAQDAVIMLDHLGNIAYWNPAAEKIFGYTREEALNHDLHNLLAPERFHAAYRKGIGHFIATGEGQVIGKTLELAALRKGGEEFSMEISLSAVKLGNQWNAIGIIRDITERKRAEEAIRRQQKFTTQIIETIPMRVFWKDRDLRFLGCNTLFAKDAGLSRPDEMIGKTDFDMGWKDQAELYRADDQRVMDSNTPKLSYDEQQTSPEGSHLWLRTSKVPLHNEANETIGMLGVYENVTKYKLMGQKLRESEESFRKAFQFSAIGMALVGLDGHWLKVNDSLCQIVGYSEQELLGKTFQDITHPEDIQSDLGYLSQLLAGKIDHYRKEKRYFHKDGHVVWIRLSVSLIRDAQDNPIHFVSQIDDITEGKHAEEEIHRLNEGLEEKVQDRTKQLLEAQENLVRKEKLAVLGQVAGSVGHELRNPLGVMSNAVFFLQNVLPDADENVKEYLGIIKSEITGSERIVSDLLDSVRTKPPLTATVDVRELLAQTLRTLSMPSAVTVKLNIPETLPPLRVDQLQIRQVFRNLISNGVEAMPQGGMLEIGAVENKQDRTVTISVRDSGIGMTPEQLGKLFQPLFTTKARGIGLGLVVVKNLTEANGGRVQVESVAGKGTLFSITLPSADSAVGTA